MVRINNTAKGIIVGILACGLMGFLALADVVLLDLNRQVYFGGFPWGVIKYCSPIALVIIVGILLGVSIFHQKKLLKKISIILTITLTVLGLGVFAYCVWFRLNNPGIGLL